MHDIGKTLLEQRCPNGRHLMGYHIPPFNSVSHLQ